MNKVLLIGNVGQDPTTRFISNGTAVANFSIATDTRYKDSNNKVHEKTQWHRCVVWGKAAETVGSYMKRGRLVCIEGEIEYDEFTNDSGQKVPTTQINVRHFRFLDKKPEQEQQAQQESHNFEGQQAEQEAEDFASTVLGEF